MKARIFTLFGLVICIALLLVMHLCGTGSISAQGPESPLPTKPITLSPPLPNDGPYQTQEGVWVMPGGAVASTGVRPMAVKTYGGPDDFGYTWDDSVVFNWIDASGGTDTGMSGMSYEQAVGPIALPFSFKFYENTYTSLYIAASGYLAFTDDADWSWQRPIPSPAKPNNVIAPYWTPLDLASDGTTNRVYYESGGTAPDRYFVVEWYQVVFYDEFYTFEVILYENGDIVFQYHAMTYNGGYACGAAGIEDSVGLDGLSYVDSCNQAPSSKAVHFYRPAPSTRVSIHPLYQGRFTHAGETAAFQVPIRNTGELGSDTYDLFPSSSWPVGLYTADSTIPLSDTDFDGTVDTGPVTQGSTITVTVRITTPTGTTVGGDNAAAITARSSLDTGKNRTTMLQTAVPAPFAQVYRDDADAAMSLYLV